MASLDSVRDIMDVRTSPEDVGLTLNISLTSYDNGLMNLNGRVIRGGHQDEVWGYTNAIQIITMMLSQFHRQVKQRRDRVPA